MKNSIKLLSILVVSMSIFGLTQGYNTEMYSAYNYAHEIGITTMSNIDQADMYGNLIRSHMAKMMVNYAKNVLGKIPNTSLSCNFTDIANQSTELKGFIIEACQLGLMGQEITAFNPNGVVTRAEFGTVLSRALYGDVYNGGNPYYKNHLNALKSVDIMTQINTPNSNEIRGYVMLMMMRADQLIIDNTHCNDKAIQLACLLGLDICPLECKWETIFGGTLSLQKISDTYNVINTYHLWSFQLTASSSDITLNHIKLYVNSTAGTIWLEKDGIRITPKTYPGSDNIVILTLSDLEILQGKSVILHIVSTHTASNVRIVNTASISSSAAEFSWNFPIVF